MPRLLLSCGEPSGDLYGAELVRELRGSVPGLEVAGLGGDRLQAQGARLLAHVRDLSVVGLLEVVSHLRFFRGVFRAVIGEAEQNRPDVAVLVDYPDFNLRLARALKRRGIPVVYYISPQVWAWRKGRLRGIRESVARMLVIFPFEEQLYRDADVPVTFVGHPLVDLVSAPPDKDAFHARHGLHRERPLIALLPGSRRKEIAHNLPALLGAVDLLRVQRPDLQFALAAAPHVEPAALRKEIADRPITVAVNETHAVLAACTAAVVASGTATVEAALLGAPMVVVYRLSPLTYALGRRFVTVPHFAMVNLIAGRRIVPEVIQHEFTPERVAAEVLSLLEGPRRVAMQADLSEVRSRLGARGGSRRAAEAVLPFLLPQNA
jgi:lipid-A-disaccharide synthase